MLRRLLNLLTALSLLLCVAACVFWARSYWRAEAVTFSSLRPTALGGGRYDGRIFRANSNPGRLVVGAVLVWSADGSWYYNRPNGTPMAPPARSPPAADS